MKKIINLALLVITLFASSAYAQTAYQAAESNVSYLLVDHFQTFISENSEGVTQLNGEEIRTHQLVEETHEFWKMVMQLQNEELKTAADIKPEAKQERFIYLLERMNEINEVLGKDRVRQFDMKRFYRLKTELVSDQAGGEGEAYESVLKDPIEIKIADVVNQNLAVFDLRKVLLRKAVLNPPSLSALIAQYEPSMRKILVESLYKNLPKLNDSQQVEFLTALLNGEGDLRMMYIEMFEHLTKTRQANGDINIDLLMDKFERMIKTEIANIIELAQVDIDISAFRSEKSEWKQSVKGKVARYQGGGTGEATVAMRLFAVLKMARF